MKNERKSLSVTKIAALSLIAGSLGSVTPIDASAQGAFAFAALGSGSQVRAALSSGKRSVVFEQHDGDKSAEGKCGEGKCGDESGDDEGDKGAEGKCGEGKCG